MERKFTDMVPVTYKATQFIPADNPPWENTRFIDDVGRLPNVEALKQHRAHLSESLMDLGPHTSETQDGIKRQKVKDKAQDYIADVKSGILPAGHGKYALQYDEKLEQVRTDLETRTKQIEMATIPKYKLVNTYDRIRGSRDDARDFPCKSTVKKEDPAIIAQILTDFGADRSNIY